MKRSFYGEADYAFGQTMLTLRTAIGLTQAGLAELLGVSRRAIGKWEAGDSYPKASHLQALLAFAVGQRAFAAGREEEEIQAFWHAAHQKVLLDEAWLQGLLGTQRPRLWLLTAQSGEQVMAQPALAGGAGQAGDGVGGRGGHGPHACRLRRVRAAAAWGGPDRAPELPAADLAGETRRPRASGGQPDSRTRLAPGRVGDRRR